MKVLSTSIGFWSLVYCIMIPHLNAFCQDSTGQIVKLVHADSLVGYSSGGNSFRELNGNVLFSQGKTTLRCDRALQNLTTNQVDLFGNVVVHDDTLTLKAKQARYFSKTKTVYCDYGVYLNDARRTLVADKGDYNSIDKIAHFTGNVFVQDSVSQLYANQLVYYRQEGNTIADGHVKIISKENHVAIYGGHFENYEKKRYSLMKQAPVLVQIDTSRDGKIDTLVIRSLLMEAFRDTTEERFVATDSVEVIRSELVARCGTGTYFANDSLIVLINSPVVWYEDNQLTGDTILVYLHNKMISKVHVVGFAFALSQSDSAYKDRFNQLKGKELTMYLNNKKVERIVVDNNAVSLYYLYDKNKPNGVNKVSGDRVIMYFKDGKIDKISVAGGVEGDYFPEKIIKGEVASYNLNGFYLYLDKPSKADFGKIFK